MCISLKSLDFFGLNIEKIQKSILTYINSTPNVHSITLDFLTLDIICSYLIAIPTFHLLFFNCYCRTFPFLPPSGPATAAWLFYIQSSHVIVPMSPVNYLSVASRVISVHSNLYGDLSAPWIILEIWKCPRMSQNFAVIGIRGIFKNLIILGNYGLWGLSKTGSAVMMNDDDDGDDDDDDNDDDDEVRVVPNMGECTVRPVTTSLLSPISSQPPPSPPKW